MPAECGLPAMQFARLNGRAVVAEFGGGVMTSDAGALLLGATDRAIGLVDRFAARFSDGRTAAVRGRHRQNVGVRRLRLRLLLPKAGAPDHRPTGDDRARLLRSLTRRLARK